MGQLFSGHGLTQPGSALMNQNGQPMAVGSPDQMLGQTSKILESMRPQGFGNVGDPLNTPPSPVPPRLGTPSFQQAASLGARVPGGENALSPALTKGGKLAVLLQNGLQGALAGRAAQEQATVQSGGRRSGGVGMAMEAGYNLPWQRAEQGQQLAQQQAQTGVLQSEAQTMNIPGVGQVPGWLAKTMGPAWLRGQAQQSVANTNVQGKENVAQTQAGTQQAIHRFIPVPNVGLFDTQTRQVIPETQQGITVTPDIAKDHELPQEFVGKPMSLTNFAQLQRGQAFGAVPVQGASGPALINRLPGENFGKVTPLGLGAPSMGAPREIADVNNPGQTIVTTGAGAQGKPGVQSASVQVPKAAAKAEVPTKIGDLKVAFNTAMQHADLLSKAFDAVNNGDVQAWNSIKNRAKTEFGWSEAPTAQLIAGAYSREINKMLTSGHVTDGEIDSAGATVPTNIASPGRMQAALAGYKALAQSKLNMLNQQKQSAIDASQPSKGGPSATDMLKKYPPAKAAQANATTR